jgi:hypothetical protein
MIRGRFTEVLWWRGRDGIRIPESGLAVPIFRGAQASESAISAGSDGAGLTGDSIGIIITRCITTTATTPAAIRFITGATSTVEQGHAVD